MKKYKILRLADESAEHFFNRMALVTGAGVDNFCNHKIKGDEAYGTLEFDGELTEQQIEDLGAIEIEPSVVEV